MKITELLAYLVSPVSPFIPFLTALFRLRKMDKAYYPLVAIFGCAFLAESYRAIQLINYYENLGLNMDVSLISYNLYVLAIGVLYTIQFKNWGLFQGNRVYFLAIIILLVGLWLFDHLWPSPQKLLGPTKIYRLSYSLILCLFSIHHINNLLVTERGSLLKNASFLVCICLLVFFLLYIINEGLILSYKGVSMEFLESFFAFRKWLNPALYLIFTLAVLWIPPKKPFIQLS